MKAKIVAMNKNYLVEFKNDADFLNFVTNFNDKINDVEIINEDKLPELEKPVEVAKPSMSDGWKTVEKSAFTQKEKGVDKKSMTLGGKYGEFKYEPDKNLENAFDKTVSDAKLDSPALKGDEPKVSDVEATAKENEVKGATSKSTAPKAEDEPKNDSPKSEASAEKTEEPKSEEKPEEEKKEEDKTEEPKEDKEDNKDTKEEDEKKKEVEESYDAELNEVFASAGVELEESLRAAGVELKEDYMSDEKIADQYSNCQIEEIERITPTHGYITVLFPNATHSDYDSEKTTGYTIYEDGKIAFDDWFPDDVYDQLVQAIKNDTDGSELDEGFKDGLKKAGKYAKNAAMAAGVAGSLMTSNPTMAQPNVNSDVETEENEFGDHYVKDVVVKIKGGDGQYYDVKFKLYDSGRYEDVENGYSFSEKDIEDMKKGIDPLGV